MRRFAVLLFTLSLAGPFELCAQDLLIDQVKLEEDGAISVGFEADAQSYYLLRRSEDLTSFEEILAIQFGTDGSFEMTDPLGNQDSIQSFYQVQRADIADPMDLDEDGIDDITEINMQEFFDPLNRLDGLEDFDLDGASNSDELRDGTDPFVNESPPIVSVSSISPFIGESSVSPNRLVRIEFDGPINPATVTIFNVGLAVNQVPIQSIVKVSPTARFLTIEAVGGLPVGQEVQAGILEDTLRDSTGQFVDVDLDGVPGGALGFPFEVLSLDRVDNTNVFGIIMDSYSETPIEGVTVRVDGIPEASAVTDATGRFELMNMPAPDFFVHIDGSTATNAPAGMTYPIVGKPFHSVAGETVQVNMNGEPFDIYLPPVDPADAIQLSGEQETDVGFGDTGKAQLAIQFPELDASTWDLLSVKFPPGSAVDRTGTAATQASIIPVPPDRTPSPVPGGMDPPLVISIQAPGATQFNVPAPITFPNLDGQAPGESTFLASFNHDSGQWESIGTGTVSEDGSVIESDPGVGIIAPGWHVVFCTVRAINRIPPDDEYGNGIPLMIPDLNGTPLRYDFGTALSGVEPGFMRATPGSLYNPTIGYGWADGFIGGVDRGARGVEDTVSDFNETMNGTFKVDLNPGFYDLRITLGDMGDDREEMEIFAEGIRVGNVSSLAAKCVITYSNTLVKDGCLDLGFVSGGWDRVAVNAVEINLVGTDFMPGQEESLFGNFFAYRKNVATGDVLRELVNVSNVRTLVSPFLAPHTHYEQFLYHWESGKVAFRESFTGSKSTLMEAPTFSFGYPDLIDSDEDGLNDLPEMVIGTDPNIPDSNGDGNNDRLSIQLRYNLP